MPSQILRIIEALHKEKDIDKEIIFQGIEAALLSAARKKYRNIKNFKVTVDRKTGEIYIITKDGEKLTPPDLGRIAAQAGKQAIIQKIREAEKEAIYREFLQKKGSIVSGKVQRYENGSIIVNLGKTKGIITKNEQIPDETFSQDREIKAYVLDVKKIGSKIKILLSRTHINFVKKLFELEVPEIKQGIIVINNIVREPGYRTKIAVSSQDEKVDCVGACVGIRGARIKNIINELNEEKIDIIRWDSNPEVLIKNALKPAEVIKIELDRHRKKARVIVTPEQQPLAIGKEGLNVRLAASLCRWDIDIVSTES